MGQGQFILQARIAAKPQGLAAVNALPVLYTFVTP
jgi:hypothetical protein